MLQSAGPPAEQVFYLWPENLDTWAHWMALQTQWRTSAVGGRTGLDYAGVRAYLDESGLMGEPRADTWRGILACERGALDGWAERERNQPQK